MPLESTGGVLSVYPYLRVKDARKAIEFYTQVFQAREKFRLTEPGGRIGHAELHLGPVILMISEEYPEMGILAPQTPGGTGASIHLHVTNADEVFERATKAGATVLRPLHDQFHGERSGAFADPFGHEWLIGHQIEEVSEEEMQRRFNKMCGAE